MGRSSDQRGIDANGIAASDAPPSLGDISHAIDPEASLPGEDPSSTRADDAIHWVTVYRELVAMKRTMLVDLDEHVSRATPETAAEARVDRRLLSTQADRYHRRLDFWTARARELTGEHAPAG